MCSILNQLIAVTFLINFMLVSFDIRCDYVSKKKFAPANTKTHIFGLLMGNFTQYLCPNSPKSEYKYSKYRCGCLYRFKVAFTLIGSRCESFEIRSELFLSSSRYTLSTWIPRSDRSSEKTFPTPTTFLLNERKATEWCSKKSYLNFFDGGKPGFLSYKTPNTVKYRAKDALW